MTHFFLKRLLLFLYVKGICSIAPGRSPANHYSIPATQSLVPQFNTRNSAKISIKSHYNQD
ncbi:MAG: hypothetical protein ACMG55_07385 [Microcoleus sp.]